MPHINGKLNAHLRVQEILRAFAAASTTALRSQGSRSAGIGEADKRSGLYSLRIVKRRVGEAEVSRIRCFCVRSMPCVKRAMTSGNM